MKGQPVRVTVFETCLGWTGIAVTDKGLAALALPKPDRSEVEARMRREHAGAEWVEPPVLKRYVSQITDYMSGERDAFDLPLDIPGSTSFQRDVWETLLRIPRGETRSYTWVAEQVGRPRAVRAVGQAVGANPIPLIVPCHRVLRSDGSLGGFGGGLELKQKLLELEGVERNTR
jgi:methylated-DNA-[protein]-cysteine S-methyltransferase